jgi:hypothetical protein
MNIGESGPNSPISLAPAGFFESKSSRFSRFGRRQHPLAAGPERHRGGPMPTQLGIEMPKLVLDHLQGGILLRTRLSEQEQNT